MRHLCVSVQWENQRNSWLIVLPFIIPCNAVTPCLFNISRTHHWKGCVPRPFSPEMKQAELHQNWWMITSKYKALKWTRLVWKDSCYTQTPGFDGHVSKMKKKKEKVKSKKKSRMLSLASLKDIIHLPSAMGGDARAISAWCDTCMGPAAYLNVPHCSASPWEAPGGAGSWCSCLGGKNETTLQRDTINKCGLGHVYPPTTWWQSLSSGVVALGANRNKRDTLQGELTWDVAQFLLLPASFVERKPQEKFAKRESFFWEEDHWQTLMFLSQVGAENLGAGRSVMKCGASSMSKHPRNLRWGSQTISKGGERELHPQTPTSMV